MYHINVESVSTPKVGYLASVSPAVECLKKEVSTGDLLKCQGSMSLDCPFLLAHEGIKGDVVL